jgi:hypothetical protein
MVIEPEFLFLFLKGMTDALAPFSYLVNIRVIGKYQNMDMGQILFLNFRPL